MIIDTSYFLNKSVFIPYAVNQPNIGGNTPSLVQKLQEEIDAYEEKLLIGALGYVQYQELKNQFEKTNNVWVFKSDALQKWIDLVDGYVYEDKKWNGLRFSFGAKKISLIAYYVFFYYLKGDFSVYSSTGIQIPNAENSMAQSPNPKLSEAWNSFIEMYWGDNSSFNVPTFGENWNGTYMQWQTGNNPNTVSLYDYLISRNDVYDTKWFSRLGGFVNPFGL